LKIELTSVAGFPLKLDAERLDIITGDGISFSRVVRKKAQMESVLMTPEAISDDTELYYNFVLQDAGTHHDAFRRLNLTFACVLLPPLRIGREFVKTHGHYHPLMPGSAVSYPEIYTHYFGRLYLLMHRRIKDHPARLDDCVLYEMQPGHSIAIPPGYLHVLINPSDEPALMAGLYCLDSHPLYEPVIEMAGAAYYLTGNNTIQPIRNPRYEICPPLTLLTDRQGTLFAPPEEGVSLWASFVAHPDRYAMLSNPLLAERHFER
jgi:glucose-6-phosphate isomerase, archaeal